MQSWWSNWAAKLCPSRSFGVADLGDDDIDMHENTRKRDVKMRSNTDKDSGVTMFTLDVFEPSSHDGKMQRISRHASKRYSEFDKLRSDLMAAGNENVAAIGTIYDSLYCRFGSALVWQMIASWMSLSLGLSSAGMYLQFSEVWSI